MFTLDPAITLGDLVSAVVSVLSVAAAIATFVVQQRDAQRQEAAQQKKSVQLQKIEIYQRLELASNEVFSFEAQHSDALEKFRDTMAHHDKFKEGWAVIEHYERLEQGEDPNTIDPSGALEKAYAELEPHIRIVRKYYEKSLNLFEVSARFRHDEIIDERVFGSWVIWYFETCREWAFRWMWPSLKKNYTTELRDVFDYPVGYFNWRDEPLEVLERDFFVHVGRLVGCYIVTDWLTTMRAKEGSLREEVARLGRPDYPKPWPDQPAYGAPQWPQARQSPAPDPLTPA